MQRRKKKESQRRNYQLLINLFIDFFCNWNQKLPQGIAVYNKHFYNFETYPIRKEYNILIQKGW